MHDLELLTKHNGILALNEASMVVVDPLLLRKSFVSGANLLLGRDPLERCVVIFVLVAPEFTDEASIFSLFSLALPA